MSSADQASNCLAYLAVLGIMIQLHMLFVYATHYTVVLALSQRGWRWAYIRARSVFTSLSSMLRQVKFKPGSVKTSLFLKHL